MLYGGLRFLETPHALQETTERLFPESKHRSKRIRKKLIKRFGGEFRKVPCMYRVGDTVFVHPAMMPELRRELKQSAETWDRQL